ncbi:MAG: hypothetical protein E6Q97_08665 [Desulfurellales bacterium]|nr:MAG: hypothetical protein E6Q97_08665 [Desulfurellales bacterium]
MIAELSSIEDRLAFALGRYCGFRIGSEIRSLRWSGIDRDKMLLTVGDVKRKTSRRCPIFVEIQGLLAEAWDAIPEGSSDWVFPSFRESTDQAFASRVKNVMRRLSIDPWPDLFLNLRRTRATEVVEDFGAKAESEWIGHGVDISLRHYQIVSQEKLDRAVGRVTTTETKVDEREKV